LIDRTEQVALNDATAQNGCPWFIPGLYRRGPMLHDFDAENGVAVWQSLTAAAACSNAPVTVWRVLATLHALVTVRWMDDQ
jgi:ectoine hydroxylase-related dioxygenase (phytanoyl-CoA dioxygenase family)